MEIPKKGKTFLAFTATWCRPCKAFKKEIDHLEGLGVKILRCDVDDHPGIAGAFNVMSVPQTFLIVDGNPVAQWIGVKSWEEMRDAWSNFKSKYEEEPKKE